MARRWELGEHGDILTEGACPALLWGEAMAKAQKESPFLEQERSGEATFD